MEDKGDDPKNKKEDPKEDPKENPKENPNENPKKVVLKPTGFSLSKTRVSKLGPSQQDLETKVTAATQDFTQPLVPPPVTQIGMFGKKKAIEPVVTKSAPPKPAATVPPTAKPVTLAPTKVPVKPAPVVAPSVAPSVAPVRPPLLGKYEFPQTLPSNTRSIRIRPDGLCFYRTILKALEQNPQNDEDDAPQEDAIQFAKEIAAWLKAHKDECQKQFDDAFKTGDQSIWEQGVQVKMSYTEYRRKISDPDLAVYPELEFCTGRAAAELKNVQFGFYGKFDDNYSFIDKSFGTSGKPIFIEFVGNNHFDLLLPEFTQAAPSGEQAPLSTAPAPTVPAVPAVPAEPLKGKVRKFKRPTDFSSIDPIFKNASVALKTEEAKNPYMKSRSAEGEEVNTLATTPFTPSNRKSFSRFVTTTFSGYSLPPLLKNKKIDPNACNDLQLQTYKYQAFIREYMRQVSPYRGVLVYHGLGSGKTCTSIAAAEALYGQGKKKVIIMTPISLRENFLNEIMFCGFRHFRLKNVWVAFPLDSSLKRLFVIETLGLTKEYVDSLMKKPVEQQVFWMPDLEQPANESNFDTLQDWQRTSIRNQLHTILTSRYTFIGYNGFSHAQLKDIVLNKPTFFDDAVIIIDEIHNLTRLMRGKLDKYLKDNSPKPNSKYYEPITVDPWTTEGKTTEGKLPKLYEEEKRAISEIKAKHLSPEQEEQQIKKIDKKYRYDRAFLFYRLFITAKNSKFIALSGTPIVNFPEEIGILGNILHGDFHCCTDIVSTVDEKQKSALEKILKMNPYVDFFQLKKGQGSMSVFFNVLQEKYKKVFEGETFKGLMRDDENPMVGIRELYELIKGECEAQKIPLQNKPKFSSLPLFPPTVDAFKDAFVDSENLKIKNKIIFLKRMSGLISYYKGSKEELMPKVISDEVVECPFSEFAIPYYAEARKRERKEEEALTKKKPLAEVEALASNESLSTSYRFRSRALCNFVFPQDIPRPFPFSKKDFKDAAKVDNEIIGDAEIIDTVEDDLESVKVQEEDEELDQELDEEQTKEEERKLLEEAKKEAAIQKLKSDITNPGIDYHQRVNLAIEALEATAPELLVSPNLEKHSSKFKKMLENIGSSRGSSLVYSTFRTLEGIGIFSIVLEANGFAQIELVGPENDLELKLETRQSLTSNPEQLRYIIYSGGESKPVRQTLIDLFNMRLDKLPTKIAEFLKTVDPALIASGNKKGELCRVFMITGAGAEGLSLKNVRSVHIMEPYWNKVRTDQVKGRAIRICSHSTLPYNEDPALNERTVEIFTYLSVFDKGMIAAKKVDNTLLILDKGVTSDQHVYNLGGVKEQIGKDFIETMKEGAIDCALNESENGGIQCYVHEGTIDDFLFDPRIREDISTTAQDSRLVPSRPAVAAATTAAAASVPVRKLMFVKIRDKEYIKETRDDKVYIFKAEDFNALSQKTYKDVIPLYELVDGKYKKYQVSNA